jgi:hypothetical protein
MNIYTEIREREILNEFMIVLFVRRYNTDSVYILFINRFMQRGVKLRERERERKMNSKIIIIIIW